MNSMKNRYRIMTNPNTYSRITCAAFGCDMRSGTNALSEIKMFNFPRNEYRRRRWELATRRANWKASSKARLCSKHFITGKPSKDPKHPDYVPSIFVFSKNIQHSKNTKKKLLGMTSKESPENSCSHGNTSSHEGTCVPPSCGIKGYCGTCFSPESVSSAFNMSLAPVNQTLARLMDKLKEMEEEREQLRNELACCREEIHQLHEVHQHCRKQSQSTSMRSKPYRSVSNPTKTSDDATQILESMYSEPVDDDDIDDPEALSSLFLEESCHQSAKRQNKRFEKMHSDEVIGIIEQCPSPKKKRVKVSSVESKSTSESSKDGKSLDSGSPITIVYLKR